MENTEFSGMNWFQIGMIITLLSIIKLQKHMYEKLRLPYLQGSHVDQDFHEGMNGQLKGSDGRGGVKNPSHLTLMYRLQRFVTGKILDDKNHNIFELQPILEKNLELPQKAEKVILVKIPRRLSESAADGMYWAAGFIAFKVKKIQKLGDYQHNATNDHAKNTFASLMNRGGITLPLKSWLKDYHAMEAMFQSYHPKYGIRPGRGLTSRFLIELKKKFPKYADPVLMLVTRVLTRFRMRAMNKHAKKKDRKRGTKKGKGEVTPRGRKKTVDLSM